jgi:transposase
MLMHKLDISLQPMYNFLSPDEIKDLKDLHRKADKKQRDKIKAILLLNRGYDYNEITEILIIDYTTVWRWDETYVISGSKGLLQDNYSGGMSKLTEFQKEELIAHLETRIYLNAKKICDYVRKRYRVQYTPKGMTSLLYQLDFTYKKPKHIPGKAYIEAQKSFIRKYTKIKKNKAPEDQLYFMDGVHPMYNSQPAYGWIRKGKEVGIKANTGRQRINLNGAYNLENHTEFIQEAEMINAQSTVSLLKEVMQKQPLGLIYLILDYARYYRNELVNNFVKENRRIRLLFLPAYSPNLNIIERLWKFFKKKKTYNTYYEKSAVFRKACLDFFKKMEKYRAELQT